MHDANNLANIFFQYFVQYFKIIYLNYTNFIYSINYIYFIDNFKNCIIASMIISKKKRKIKILKCFLVIFFKDTIISLIVGFVAVLNFRLNLPLNLENFVLSMAGYGFMIILTSYYNNNIDIRLSICFLIIQFYNLYLHPSFIFYFINTFLIVFFIFFFSIS